MKIVDANVLLRYILRDNEEMYQQAEVVISQGAMTTCEVLAEVSYVLRNVYKISRKDISWFLTQILIDVHVDNKKAMLYALSAYDLTSLDFVDCVMLAYKKVYKAEIFTFDKKLNSYLNKELMIFQN